MHWVAVEVDRSAGLGIVMVEGTALSDPHHQHRLCSLTPGLSGIKSENVLSLFRGLVAVCLISGKVKDLESQAN